MRLRGQKGISMIEVLVVVLVFSVITVMGTESILYSLRGSRRSESTIGVRENVNYSLAVMERELHNAESVTCPSSTSISYTNEFSPPNFTFTCTLVPAPPDGFIASGSARLTGSDILVTACSFFCDPGGAGVPPSVMISITAKDKDAIGLEGAEFTTNTRINLRTY
jgi:prepilin-type N-terminal cleavage/methylation domain-containing protein